jgi:flagellar hook-associated protein 1 FlgK
MGVGNILQTGRTGMTAAKTGIATTGHNISNATTEGFSRQRVQTTAETPRNSVGGHLIGDGTRVSRIERVNDEYIEKQIRNTGRDLAKMQEKDLALRQTEDIFNEMGGEGLNRIMSKFFNDFRRLSMEPENTAIRQSVRESSMAMISDFKRLRTSIEEVARGIDSRLDGYTSEANSLATQLRDLNLQIKKMEVAGSVPNDLLDRRDQTLKQLGSLMELTMHKSNDGQYTVEVRGVGPLVVGPNVQRFSVFRSQAENPNEIENSLQVRTSSNSLGRITNKIQGGKIGALLEVRDHTLSTILNRLDELAYTVSESVNQVHEQGFTRDGRTGVGFFKKIPPGTTGAANFLDLSEAVKSDINSIAASAEPNSPGDNRIAIALSGLQGQKLLNGGQTTVDDYYNSIVSDVGVASARNKDAMNQSQDIATQLNKIREQVSGVSIDEETANLMQYQNAFGASAKVIQVADEMLKTILDLKR